jgi:hypothetical protein
MFAGRLKSAQLISSTALLSSTRWAIIMAILSQTIYSTRTTVVTVCRDGILDVSSICARGVWDNIHSRAMAGASLRQSR